ncbi:MAG: hypothetical protein H6990_10620 [Pseudomonadales bacterium]|nr:hypothetical protein [Pseudomonadales bacterium]MCP5165496.1 hypothetical protein [Pseudomonadales bacterium]MCP5192651.1 hypothetical protein [Pseudomonadales bacterium]
MACPKVVVDVCQRREWRRDGQQATLILPGGRHQVVGFEQFLFEGEEMLRVSTTVGPVAALSDIQLSAVLGLNASLAFGALAIAGADLVITDTLLLTSHCHEQLGRAMRFIAETADRYEREIYHTDQH